MNTYPGSLEKHTLFNWKYPEKEYDENGIPYGIQIDYDNPFLDSVGNKRNVYVYRPSTLLSGRMVPMLCILQDSKDEQSIRKCLYDTGLINLAEKEGFFLVFPISGQNGWNVCNDIKRPDDIQILNKIFEAATMWYLFPGREKCNSYMMGCVGIGTGAELAHIFASQYPRYLSSLLTFGGTITKEMMPEENEDAEMSVWMVDAKGDGYTFWMDVNQLKQAENVIVGNTMEWVNLNNRAKRLRLTVREKSGDFAGIIARYWYDIHSLSMRTPNTKNGRMFSTDEMFENYQPCVYNGVRMLGDNNQFAHFWYEFIPKCIHGNKKNEDEKYPLIIALHGGGDNHLTAAAMFKWHELGEKEGFITVYPNASDNDSWNSMMYNNRIDDIEFLTKLILHLKEKYPVDSRRVYMSGFSNGSGMAQVLSACRPDLIAGVVAFNTRFPMHEGVYEASQAVKAKFDYRMPVFSTYGTKDAEYPPQEGSGQFFADAVLEMV